MSRQAELRPPRKAGRLMQTLLHRGLPIWIDEIWIETTNNNWYRRYLSPAGVVLAACVKIASGHGRYEYSTGYGWTGHYDSFDDAVERLEAQIWRMYAAPEHKAPTLEAS